MTVFEAKQVSVADGKSVTLRSPEEDDAQRLIDYLDSVRRETPFLAVSPADPLPTLEAERAWVRGLREGLGVQIAADGEGEIIALCSVQMPAEQRLQHVGEIGMSIRAAWCGRGLGTLLMQELIAWAQAAEHVDVLTLSLHGDNTRALRLYQRSGFVIDGRRPWHIMRNSVYVDQMVMSRWVGQSEAPHTPA